MTDFHIQHDASCTERGELAPSVFGHPDDILADCRLSTAEKRALLASWASDANAVPHLPTLRQLPDGSIVRVDDILRALKVLDACGETVAAQASHAIMWRRPFNRRQGWSPRRWPGKAGSWDDDDDPPPCPASAAVRPRTGGGAAFASAEPVYA